MVLGTIPQRESEKMYGIFASTIPGKHDHSIQRLRLEVLTEEQATRIVEGCVVSICVKTKEEPSDIDMDIESYANAMPIRAKPWIKRVSVALSLVESAYMVYHPLHGAGEGMETATRIADHREGADLAELLLTQL